MHRKSLIFRWASTNRNRSLLLERNTRDGSAVTRANLASLENSTLRATRETFHLLVSINLIYKRKVHQSKRALYVSASMKRRF
ncbi:unnamed protein product [Arabidopsis halleri]